MNKEKVITYIKEVLAKNFTGNGIYSNREDSPQIYNALMSIDENIEYKKMAALLNLIRTKMDISNKNLDDFIDLLNKEAAKEVTEEVVPNPLEEEIEEKPPVIINNNVEEDEEDNNEAAKGNIMIFVISLLVLIIIILGVIIFLFC